MAPSSDYQTATLALLESTRDRIRTHAASEIPNEAVGILSAQGTLYPLINQRRSNHQFSVSPVFISEGMQWLKDRGDRGVAFYHSHPTTPATPSDADVLMMRSAPYTIHVIAGVDRIAAYLCEDDTADPLLVAEVAYGEYPPTD